MYTQTVSKLYKVNTLHVFYAQLYFAYVFCFAVFSCTIAQASDSCSNIPDISGTCIAADDFGIGGIIYIQSNPDEKVVSKEKSKLVQYEPLDRQIAPWVDSGFFTLGKPPDPDYPNQNKLKLTVTGSWYPWGRPTCSKPLPKCNMIDCNTNKELDRPCLKDGKVVDESDLSKLPCELTDGWGLYGLIAIAGSNGYQDPNILSNAQALPSSSFRTFRVAPLKKGKRIGMNNDSGEEQFEYEYILDATEQCNSKTCKKDVHPLGGEYVMPGRLYFKVLDKHYLDNIGAFTVNVVQGVYTEKGFIETTADMFEQQISKVTARINKTITHDTRLLTIVRTMLLLYVAITGVMFMMGMVKMHQRELVVRLIKIGVIATLVSDMSWEFFNIYLFGLCKDGARSIADMIIRATLYNNGLAIYAIPDNATPLSVYDLFLKLITKMQIHAKTWSLLFYDWKLYWIPCIYVCIFFVLLAIIKSLMLYLLMLIQVTLLLVIAPIFIIMLLFKITSDLFDTWLKQLIASGLLYIMIAVSIGLMLRLIVGQLEDLLRFRICWQTIWSLDILGTTLFELKFWYPQSASEVMVTLTPLTFIAFLIVAVLFNTLMEQIPMMVDLLSNSAMMPFSRMYEGGVAQYKNILSNAYVAGAIHMVKGAVKQYNPIGQLIDRGPIKSIIDKGYKRYDQFTSAVSTLSEGGGDEIGGDTIDNKGSMLRKEAWLGRDKKAGTRSSSSGSNETR